MLVTVNGTDITEHISPSSYSMNAVGQYQSWMDGNYVEHRIYARSRIKGEFTIALYGRDNMDTQAFLDLWDGAVDNNIVTILVFVQNTNKMEAIEAYFKFEGAFHREMINGEYCDVLKVEIQER